MTGQVPAFSYLEKAIMSAISNIERIKVLSAALLKEEKAIQRCRDNRPDFDATPARRQRYHDKLNGYCEERNRLKHRLHVACVDAGIADYRGDEYYRDAIVERDGAFTQQHIDSKDKPRQFIDRMENAQ